MSLQEIKYTDRDKDARRVLTERAKEAPELNLVVVIEQYKDGGRRIITSMGSFEEKALLKCFFDRFVMDWFADSYEEEPK